MTRIIATGNLSKWKVPTQWGKPFLFGKNISKGYRKSNVKVRSTQLEEYLDETELDLLYLASSLLRFEELARKGQVHFKSHISFVVSDPEKWSSEEVKENLSDILSLTLPTLPEVDFLEGPPSSTQRKESSLQEGSVTLFSGGVDSFVGLFSSSAAFDSTAALFVSHSQLKRKIGELKSGYFEERNIPLWTINVQRSGGELQQLRGFLYLICGSVATRIANCDTLVVTESGPTMYQPQFIPNDEVTLTTHPRLIRSVKSLVSALFGRDVSFAEPFEDMTKAEVLALCEIPEAIPNTHSCITSQFVYHPVSHPVSHCGRCYACLVRRISAIVAHVPDAMYAYDVFLQDVGDVPKAIRGSRRITSRHMENLYVLLRFALDVLENRVPDFTAQKIEEFGRWELFERFASDVFSAIHIAYDVERKGRNKFVSNFLSESISRGSVSKESLENRISEVRERKHLPDFNMRI